MVEWLNPVFSWLDNIELLTTPDFRWLVLPIVRPSLVVYRPICPNLPEFNQNFHNGSQCFNNFTSYSSPQKQGTIIHHIFSRISQVSIFLGLTVPYDSYTIVLP